MPVSQCETFALPRKKSQFAIENYTAVTSTNAVSSSTAACSRWVPCTASGHSFHYFAKVSSVVWLYELPCTVCYSSWMVLMSIAYCSSSLSYLTFGYVWCFLVTNSACRQRPEAGPCLLQQSPKSVADRWISDLLRDWPHVYFQMHAYSWTAETWEGKEQVLLFFFAYPVIL